MNNLKQYLFKVVDFLVDYLFCICVLVLFYFVDIYDFKIELILIVICKVVDFLVSYLFYICVVVLLILRIYMNLKLSEYFVIKKVR